jgi:formate hydrogenlyase subunit 3/multisubunit Na+/H+ antiporter MnhD subunit
MPFVAWVTLVGVLTSAGLPPLAGFVSEWLLLQSFLFTPGLPDSLLNMLIPVVAALIALVAALAGYTMVIVLRRDLPRPAARGEAGAGARRRRLGTRGHACGWRWAASRWGCCRRSSSS